MIYILLNDLSDVVGVFEGTEEELSSFLENDEYGSVVTGTRLFPKNSIDPWSN
jgi:hypothetical protein